jgi:hypothetical protein
MKSTRLLASLLALAILAVLAGVLPAAEPAPRALPTVAVFKPFALPAADGAGITCMFVPGTEPGTVVLLIQSDFSAYKLVEVTPGPGPNPDPGPDPGPDPTPGHRFVLILRESSTPTIPQSLVIAAVRGYATGKNHVFRCEDQDSEEPDGSQTPWVDRYEARAKAAGVSLPALVVSDSFDTDKCVIVPLGDDPDAAIAAIKKAGG